MPKPEVGQNFLTFGLIQAVLALKYAFPHQGGPENSKPLEVSRCHKHLRASLPQRRQQRQRGRQGRSSGAVARSRDAAFPTQQYNVHPGIGPLRSRSPANASLSVWRTVRGLRYSQIWEMVRSAAVTAGYLPAQRRTVCLPNHSVSIHGALSSTRLQPE